MQLETTSIRKIHSPLFRRVLAIGLCAGMLVGLAGCNTTRNNSGPPPEDVEPPPVLGPSDFMIGNVSRIHKIRSIEKYVLVQADQQMPEGSTWKVMKGPRTVAVLEVPAGGHARHPFYVANIVEGTPEIGDEVYPK